MRFFTFDGARNKRRGSLEHVDLLRAPVAFLFAVVEAEETPPFPPHHDRDRDEGERTMLEKHLPRIAGSLTQLGFDDLAACAPDRPVVAFVTLVRDWHIVIARIFADRRQSMVGPVE